MSSAAAQQYLNQSSTQHLESIVSSVDVAKAQLAGAKQKKISQQLQESTQGLVAGKGVLKSVKKVAGGNVGSSIKSGIKMVGNKVNSLASHLGEDSISSGVGNIIRGGAASVEDAVSRQVDALSSRGANVHGFGNFESTGQYSSTPHQGLASEGLAPTVEEASSAESVAGTAASAAGSVALDETAEASTAAAASQGFLDPVSDAIGLVADVGAVATTIAGAVEGSNATKKQEDAINSLQPSAVSGFQKSNSAN